ncbi:LOW QUALITY PROTEIN: tetratricopeptide repeat protein 31-like [Gymnodraco acuticeps]|uniref:LOW QUALITY PROTEIN: tetratricopeptide repeat protein 31-like n=1 Tax=Gymnodraco acuticeps TaxID=8218 RepID=A0A6P8VQN8_GYMAC|nr:LOW QUALITY PROTEIN: tetratricopeptide repeat protein 31-like [Gymnodraco acuticeps]
MDIFREETEFTDIRMVHRMVNLFESRPGIQGRFRVGVVANISNNGECGVTEEVYGEWGLGPNNFTAYSNLADWNSGTALTGGSAYQPPDNYYPSSSAKVQPKESDAERRARLLEEVIKSKEKAEKKRIKKQKRKERKRLEKLEKEKLNPETNKEAGEAAQQSKSEGSAAGSEESKNKPPAEAKDSGGGSSGSSEEESSDEDTKKDPADSEELDMSSTFVSNAAQIARRQLEQNPRAERRGGPPPPPPQRKLRAPLRNLKEPQKKTRSRTLPPPTLEDNVKISTDLAVIGNKFASAGDFNMAVKYFTDAIKYNPTEFKLFGNRSFCFEKSQQFEKALADAELCLSMNPGWVKAHFRRGRALAGLKRYAEAAGAFREVLSLDGSCAEAAQELMRVQITQLMEYGFTREQSSNALIIHGTVEKALEVLSALNRPPGTIQGVPLKPAQLVNINGVSPVLSANISPAALPLLHPPAAPFLYPVAPHPHSALQLLKNKPLVQNMSNIQSQQKIVPNQAMKSGAEQELFPVWVGNLVYPLSEAILSNMFNNVGPVHSVKLLINKRCAFVNYTKRDHCDEAIRRLHGSDLNGMKIAVRYPDRIPPGMGISRSALKAEDQQDENMRQSGTFWPSRPGPDFRGSHKF